MFFSSFFFLGGGGGAFALSMPISKIIEKYNKSYFCLLKLYFQYFLRANLSNDYFTNRQDRYVVIENCPDLANFYHRLIATVSKFSLQLEKDNSTNMLPDVKVHPFLVSCQIYHSYLAFK